MNQHSDQPFQQGGLLPPQTPNHVCQHLHDTEAALDTRLEQLRAENNYEHFAQPTQNTSSTQLPAATALNTIDPARLQRQPRQLLRATHAAQQQYIGSLQVHHGQDNSFPYLMIPASPEEEEEENYTLQLPPNPLSQQLLSSQIPFLAQRPLQVFPVHTVQTTENPPFFQTPPSQSFLTSPSHPYQTTFDSPWQTPALRTPPRIRTPSLSHIWQEDAAWMPIGQREGSSPPARLPPEDMAKVCRTYAGIDLDSWAQTRVPEFHFPDPPPPECESAQSQTSNGVSGMHVDGTHEAPFPGPITLLHTPNVVSFCVLFKKYLLDVFGWNAYGVEGILRMEKLDLWKLDGVTEGYVLLAEQACTIGMPAAMGQTKIWKTTKLDQASGQHEEVRMNLYGKKWSPATVVAVLVPKKGTTVGGQGDKFGWEKDARFFYCNDSVPITPVLKMLEKTGIKVLRSFSPGSLKHKQFSIWLGGSFLKAVIPPDSQDYKHAMIDTDCCPSVIDPDNALNRLYMNSYLHFAGDVARDLSDDRYLNQLHPAEREAASLSNLKCAEYLFIKRGFFKSFFEEIYRSDKKIDPNASSTASVRGVSAHIQSQSHPRQREHEYPHREDTPMSTSADPAVTPVRASRAASRAASSRATPARASGAVSAVEFTPVAPTSTQSRDGGWPARRDRVRTERAHLHWLEKTYGLKWTQSKRLVVCWRLFGFLDEGRFLDWVRAGGMFEDGEVQEDESEDTERSEC